MNVIDGLNAILQAISMSYSTFDRRIRFPATERIAYAKLDPVRRPEHPLLRAELKRGCYMFSRPVVERST